MSSTEHGYYFSKWDLNPKGTIPLFLADMDFPTAPGIRKALTEVFQTGCFGYAWSTMELLALISSKYQQAYDWHIHVEDIMPCSGLLYAIDTVLSSLSSTEDELILLTPEYPGIIETLKKQALKTIEVPLLEKHKGASLSYGLDLEKIESAITKKTRFLLFSSPHNPTGTVFTWNELAQLARLCLKHNMIIISDEIWSSLILDQSRFVPVGSLSSAVAQQSITLNSPSKAYNLGGLASGYMIVQNPEIKQGIQSKFIPYSSIASYTGMLAAYKEDGVWLADTKVQLNALKRQAILFFEKYFPDFHISQDPATYLLWLKDSQASNRNWPKKFEEDAKVLVKPGIDFGKAYQDYFRISCASSEAVFEDVFARLKQLSSL